MMTKPAGKVITKPGNFSARHPLETDWEEFPGSVMTSSWNVGHDAGHDGYAVARPTEDTYAGPYPL